MGEPVGAKKVTDAAPQRKGCVIIGGGDNIEEMRRYADVQPRDVSTVILQSTPNQNHLEEQHCRQNRGLGILHHGKFARGLRLRWLW